MGALTGAFTAIAIVLCIATRLGATRNLERELYPGRIPFQKGWVLEVPVAKLINVRPFCGKVVSKEIGFRTLPGSSSSNVIKSSGTNGTTYFKVRIRSSGTDIIISEDKPDTNLLSFYLFLRENNTYQFPRVIKEFY